MSGDKRNVWSQAAIRMAADIAAEKGVTIQIERDGAIVILPPQADAVEEVRAFIAARTDPPVL